MWKKGSPRLCPQSWLNKANPRLQPAFISLQDLGMPVGVSCTLLSRQRMPGLGGADASFGRSGGSRPLEEQGWDTPRVCAAVQAQS